MSRRLLCHFAEASVVGGIPAPWAKFMTYCTVAGTMDQYPPNSILSSIPYATVTGQLSAGEGIRKQQVENKWPAAASLERDSSEMTEIVSSKGDNEPSRRWDRLMAAAQVGDENAYRALLSELAIWLRRYYARRLPAAAAEDAVQDVLLAIHEKRRTYDPERPFGPWLASIARYKWIDRLRSLKSEAAEPLDEDMGIPDHGDRVVAGATFQQLVAELKPAQAEAIRLVKLEGYSVKEASLATAQSMSLIKINVHRGVKRLAEIIKATDDAGRLRRRS